MRLADTGNRKSQSPTRPDLVSGEQVEIEYLRGQLKAMQARVAVTEDLELQVKRLKEQLNAANKTNSMLHRTLSEENRTLLS